MTAVASSYFRIDPAKLREARRALVMTQEMLAEKSGVSYDTIRRIEGSQRSHRYILGHQAGTVRALATALALSPVDILCTSYPQGRERGQERGNSPTNSQVKSPGISLSRGRVDLDLSSALAFGSQTINAEGKDLSPQAASNGNGKGPKRFYLADVLNLGLVTALVSRHPDWERKVTHGLLTSLVLGSEERKIPAYGARAVNAAIDALYENSASVSDPAGYLRRVCEEVGL